MSDVAVALGYVSLALLKLVFIPTLAVWPSVGVAFAAALLMGDRAGRGVFIGSLIANFGWAISSGIPIFTVGAVATNVFITTGNTLAAVLSARCLRRVIGRRDPFDSPPDALWFCVCGAGTFALITTFIGGVINQLWNSGYAILDWFISDFNCVILIAPVILLWLRPGRRTFTARETLEIGGVALFSLGATWLLFSPYYGSLSPVFRRPLWLLLPIVWASVRFRQEINASLLAMCFFIIWRGTAAGHGPFAGDVPDVRQAIRIALAMLGASGMALLIISAMYNERKRAEEELRQSELKFRTLVEQSLVGVYIIQDNRFVYVNRRAAEIHGYTPEEILVLADAQSLVLPEDLPVVQEQFRLRLSGQNDMAHYSFRGLRKNGSTVIVEVRGVRIEYEGKPTLIGTLLDITEQKRAEESLHRLSARLLQLQDEERRRIARELHDTTAQGLAALAMNLSLLRSATAGNDRAERILADSLALAEGSSQEIRTLSYLLHPPELEAVGLRGAIREYAAGFARRSGIETAVDIPPELGRLPHEMELALFRIVQECLGNIHRHARSSTATIRLERDREGVTLEIRDTGRGMPSAQLARFNHGRGDLGDLGVGIAGMRERLRQLNGGLKIESGVEGTVVRAAVPVPGTAS